MGINKIARSLLTTIRWAVLSVIYFLLFLPACIFSRLRLSGHRINAKSYRSTVIDTDVTVAPVYDIDITSFKYWFNFAITRKYHLFTPALIMLVVVRVMFSSAPKKNNQSKEIYTFF